MNDASSKAPRLSPAWAAAAAAGVVLFVGLSACGSSSTSNAISQTGVRKVAAGAETECTPAVMVVRHAEDVKNPAGGADILSVAGKQHAELYVKFFADYLATKHSVGPGGAEVTVCPIGKIIAIDHVSNPQNRGPSTNPYQTILPLADELKLTIQTKDPQGVHYSTVYDWTQTRRLTLLANTGATGATGTTGQTGLTGSTGATGATGPARTSTVIAWDKQGLYPNTDDLTMKKINGNTLESYHFVPLLQALPTDKTAIVGSGTYTPQRTDFYVFALQDAVTGKFASAKAYKQEFSDDNGRNWYYTTALGSNNNPNAIRFLPAN